jgi:hypothetical protein
LVPFVWRTEPAPSASTSGTCSDLDDVDERNRVPSLIKKRRKKMRKKKHKKLLKRTRWQRRQQGR